MAEKTIAGVIVSVNDEGYLTDPKQWTKEIAAVIAQEEGITLSDTHYKVIDFLRDKTLKGETLTLRSIGKSGVVDTKGFYELFPGAPLKKATKIAGLPKPTSCV